MKKGFIHSRSPLLNNKQQLLLLLVCVCVSLVFLVPHIYNFSSLVGGFSPEFKYFLKNSFLKSLGNTVLLCVLVCAFASFIGGGAAVFMPLLPRFLKPIFGFLVLVPLSIPSYVMAFIYSGSFSVGSDLDQFFVKTLGLTRDYLPSSDSLFLLSFSMGAVLSPYVFIAVGLALRSIPQSVLEASEILSSSIIFKIKKIYLPAILPWWREALLLISMECVADFGAVAIFNYETLSLSIYKQWFGMFSIESAREIASLVILMMFACIALAKWKYIKRIPTKSFVKEINFQPKSKMYQKISISFFVVSLSFCVLLPVVQLIYWSLQVNISDLSLLPAAINSISIALLVLIPLLALALLFAVLRRFNFSIFSQILNSISRLGYAIPGTVLAVGCYYSLASFDHYITQSWGVNTSLFIGSIGACVFALSIRFFNVIYTPIETAVTNLSASLEEASMSLGYGALATLRRVHLPILIPVVLNASVLLIIDILKEMPIQLMTRSLGWDGISVKIFEYSSEGEWEFASVYALCLIVVGLIPVILLKRTGDESRN